MNNHLNARILVVDDEPRLAESTRAVLAADGYSVDTVFPAAAAVARINAGEYDLVLLDVMMPGMTGFEMMDALDRDELETLFIVMTGDTSIDTAVQALRRGATDYIRKPCDPDELLIRVDKALNQRQLKREHHLIEAEKQNLESQLRHSQKMDAIGRLTGGIAHDFNNILGIILGNAELAKRTDLPAPACHHLDNILIATMRARELINQLLSFSRKSETEWNLLELGTILDESISLVRASIPRNIEIQVDPPDSSCFVQADATQLHQVILNLCTNAAHAMEPDGGILRVQLDNIAIDDDTTSDQLTAGTYARIRITDTGHGIPHEIIDRIFEPYFSTKNPGQGTGLGLSVVHGIVLHHKGQIDVHSEAGVGTRFDILLPLSQSTTEVASTPGRKDCAMGGESILLVDDEEMVVEVTRTMLEQLGYQVQASTSATIALDTFERDPLAFDLVITDMTMPGLDGAQLARRLQALRNDIKVLICSGYNEHINEAAMRDSGIMGLIKKPIGMAELAQSLREIFDNRPNEDRASRGRDERRIQPRYQARRGTFVIFESRPSWPAPLLDISRSGLALTYDRQGGEPDSNDRLSIVCADSGFIVDRISCATVSEIDVADGEHPAYRRRGMRFEGLTTHQRRKLDAFILHHTMPPAAIA